MCHCSYKHQHIVTRQTVVSHKKFIPKIITQLYLYLQNNEQNGQQHQNVDVKFVLTSCDEVLLASAWIYLYICK